MDVKWIKITTDIFSNEKILLIDSMPDRDAILVVWFKLLILAGGKNVSHDGRLMFNNRMPYTDEMLATIFKRPLATVRLALKTFEDFEMVEVNSDNEISVVNWSKYQNIDGLEKIRANAAARQRKFREKVALEKKETPILVTPEDSNVTVTLSNASRVRTRTRTREREKNKDIKIKELVEKPETETPKSKPKSKAKTQTLKDLELYNMSDKVKTKLLEFGANRKDMKKPLTDRAFVINAKRTEAYYQKYGQDEVIGCIDDAIASCWLGIFYDRLDKTKGKVVQPKKVPDEFMNDWLNN